MIIIKGSEALQRKLKRFPTEGKKALRYGTAQGARLTVWFFKGGPPKFTGSTIKAIGNKERMIPGGYEQFVGVRQDKQFNKNLYWRLSNAKGGGKYREYSLRKNKSEGFTQQQTVVKQPILYAGIVHNKNPWMKDSWGVIRNRVSQTIITKANERISQLLLKKG